MFKSIFSKMFSINILIIVFVFTVIGLALFPLLGEYATRQQKDLITGYADQLSDLSYLAVEGDLQVFNLAVVTTCQAVEADVIVTDINGRVVSAAYTDQNKAGAAYVPEGTYEDVVAGKTVARIGKFGGSYTVPVLTVGVPLQYNRSVIGAILINAPMPNIYRMRGEILWLLLWIVAFAFILEFALIFITTRRFSNNIREISGAARQLADGEFYKRVKVKSQDEIGELAVSFNQMAESLEKLEDLRRSFIANASHELRTPVTTINGFVEGILDETIPPEKQKQYLEIVLSESKRLGRLTSTLLDVAKLDSANLKLEYSEFDINELIRRTIISLESRIDEKEIEVNVYFEEDPICVWADRDAIQRVLINLLDNAFKFTPVKGNVRIVVEMVKGKVQVFVENSGEGIAPEEQNRIFDRFYKSDQSRGMDKKGVGLGLFLVKNILTLHGERIWVESEPGKFARFTFTLQKASKKLNEKADRTSPPGSPGNEKKL